MKRYNVTLLGGPLDGEIRKVGEVNAVIAPPGQRIDFGHALGFSGYVYRKTKERFIWRHEPEGKTTS